MNSESILFLDWLEMDISSLTSQALAGPKTPLNHHWWLENVFLKDDGSGTYVEYFNIQLPSIQKYI